jgi:hypothetical protein
MNKKIIWLSSYPKSGNTWIRIFLANYIKDDQININNLSFLGHISSSKHIFDKYNNIKSNKLSINKRDEYRSSVYQKLNDDIKKPVYNKCHDKYDHKIFSVDYSYGVIYIIRNPLDVCLSYSKHYGLTIDDTITKMNNKNNKLSPKVDNKQLRQKLGTWSEHVLSWTTQTDIPLLIVKYEDMLLNPYDTFKKIIEFTPLDFNDDRLKRAIDNSSFNIVKKQEKEHGFKEKSKKSDEFFTNGKINVYKDKLSTEQINKILNDHYDVMKKFNYLPT